MPSATYLRRKEQGFCVSCGEKPPAAGAVRCEGCLQHYRDLANRHYQKNRERVRASQNASHDAKRSQGRCGLCGKEPEPGKSRCSDCIGIGSRASKRYNGRHKDAISERSKLLRRERRGRGLCQLCPREASPGKSYCHDCLTSHRQACKRHYQKRREQWRAAGLCLTCGKDRPTSGEYCDHCRAGQEFRRLRKERAYKSSGLCPACGQPAATGRVWCKDCRGKMRQREADERQRWEEEGLCLGCGKERDGDTKHCAECRTRKQNGSYKRKERRRLNGLCVWCRGQAFTQTKWPLCQRCWFKTVARNRTGDPANAAMLAELWGRQAGRCAYTGEELVPGVTASVDHKTPSKRGGSNDAENLHWVSVKINTMKSNRTHEEFIELCRSIAARFLDVAAPPVK